MCGYSTLIPWITEIIYAIKLVISFVHEASFDLQCIYYLYLLFEGILAFNVALVTGRFKVYVFD